MGLFDQLPAPKRPAEFEAEDSSHGKAPRLGAAPGADRLLALQARVSRALHAKNVQSSGRDECQRPRGCDTDTAGASPVPAHEPLLPPSPAASAASAAAHLAEPSAADLEDLDESGPPLEAATVQAAGAEPAAADDLPPPPPPPPPPPEAPGSGGAGDDQVSAALRKIAAHIGQPKKFGKASALLRELLAQVWCVWGGWGGGEDLLRVERLGTLPTFPR
jgi:hypothetical protein